MGLRVLDLGCAYFEERPEQSTPEYFLEQGASYVVGVDLTLKNLNYITDPNIALIEVGIDSPEEIANLYKRFEPEVVKCDIEGGEVHLLALSEGIFKMPKTYAIETHNDELFEAASTILRHHGYKIKTIVDLVETGVCKVIHAVR